jgi:enterobactin synthetase component D
LALATVTLGFLNRAAKGRSRTAPELLTTGAVASLAIIKHDGVDHLQNNRIEAKLYGLVKRGSMNILTLSPMDISKLFPDYVVHRGMTSWKASTLPAEILLPAALKRAVRRRQIDYVTGRLCARDALSRLGSAVVDIPPGEDGCPAWPSGVVGSITHSNGLAFAAVTWESRAKSLGIDIEKIMPSATAEEMMPLVATPQEYQNLLNQPVNTQLMTTIIFCAKETIFKCLYPILKFRFDFTDVEIVAIDIVSGRFSAISRPLISKSFPELGRLTGGVAVIGDSVYTSLLLPPS